MNSAWPVASWQENSSPANAGLRSERWTGRSARVRTSTRRPSGSAHLAMLTASMSSAVVASYRVPGISTEPSGDSVELPSVMVLMALCSLKKERPEAHGSHRTTWSTWLSLAAAWAARVAPKRIPTRPTFVHSGLAHQPQGRLDGRQPRFGPAGVVIGAGRVTGAVVIEPHGAKTAGREALRQQPEGIVGMEQVEGDRGAYDYAPPGQTIRRAVEPPEGGPSLGAEPNGTGAAHGG